MSTVARYWCCLPLCLNLVTGCSVKETRRASVPEHALNSPAAHGAEPQLDKAGAPVECAGTPVDSMARCVGPSGEASIPAEVHQARPRPGGLLRGEHDVGDRFLALGEAAIEREDYQAAADHFSRAQAELPSHPAPIVGLVLADLGRSGIPVEYAGAVGNERVESLLVRLNRALEIEPNYGPARLHKGRLLLIRGDARAAEIELRRAVEQIAYDAEAHSALAVALLAGGKTEAALSRFRRATELEPDNPQRLANLGTALMMEGKAEEAIVRYRQAVSLAPEDARARSDLGTALLALGEPKSALKELMQGFLLAPKRATIMSNIGYAHQQLGASAEAQQWYEAALQNDPKLGSAWINLGTLLAAKGKYALAGDAFRSALALDPEDPRALINLKELNVLATHESK